ncbi:antibiotic biosynthesis monooxygenase [Prescottella defluvii]|uniref:antibiotic biosynthesis monooxygenase family protein n=1 Tax=Prescottella defluvii TaxID=1323361 RepID=UPI001E427ACE|nr:antibiotic biosynthesis monooxygenase [Prescottella defluvii]
MGRRVVAREITPRHRPAPCTPIRRLELSRCLERPDAYLLLVEWDTLEDHTEGFRGSSEYQEGRRLLHHFYDPFPTVEHYVRVDDA